MRAKRDDQRSLRDVPYFYQPDISETMTLSAEESAHAMRVLRMGVGEPIRITDGRGHLYEGTIGSTSKVITLHNLNEIELPTVSSPPLHIAIAPTKNADRIEWMAEKLCELGLAKLSIVYTEHTIRRGFNLSRVEKIIVSAMKQSRKVWMTELNSYDSLEDFLRSDLAPQRLIGYCGEEFERREAANLLERGRDSVFLIGPEGDFSPSEVAASIEAGFVPALFGRERLRTETAGLYAGMLHHILNT